MLDLIGSPKTFWGLLSSDVRNLWFEKVYIQYHTFKHFRQRIYKKNPKLEKLLETRLDSLKKNSKMASKL